MTTKLTRGSVCAGLEPCYPACPLSERFAWWVIALLCIMPKEQTFCQSPTTIEHSVRGGRAEFWTLWHRPFAIAPRVPVHFHIGARFGASASLPSRWQPMRHPPQATCRAKAAVAGAAAPGSLYIKLECPPQWREPGGQAPPARTRAVGKGCRASAVRPLAADWPSSPHLLRSYE